MIRRSKKTLARNRIIKQLDDLARQRVFERDGFRCVRCTKCERSGWKIDWAHIISRRHHSVRWEADNALTLCFTCHDWWHKYPTLSGPWFLKNWPDRHERIYTLYNIGGKVDIKALLEHSK